MAEYIERESLVNRLTDLHDWCKDERKKGLEQSICIVHEQPAADVVEVVRCKDCKYLYCLSAIDRRFYCRHTPHGLQGINIIEDNPYCSYGERREEQEDGV